MERDWFEELICVIRCPRCDKGLGASDPRILSVYDHQAICMECKRKEEKQADYKEVSMQVAEYCLIHSESGKGDPRGYCYHHFYPYQSETVCSDASR